jgi:hypothetical protein
MNSRGTAAAIGMALWLIACSRAQTTRGNASRMDRNYTGPIAVDGATACSYLGRVGPPSYSVRDIGKHRIPKVPKRDLRMLHQLMRYVHPSTLRFAYLSSGFSVFDATNGPCSATPYQILNASSCNAIYVPFDANGEVGAATGCNAQPRPWIPHDIGNPHGLSWKDYPNSH